VGPRSDAGWRGGLQQDPSSIRRAEATALPGFQAFGSASGTSEPSRIEKSWDYVSTLWLSHGFSTGPFGRSEEVEVARGSRSSYCIRQS
jgi:hypothetical protein